MIFKGRKFRHSHVVVSLPWHTDAENPPSYAHPGKPSSYVYFGRAVRGATGGARGLVKTHYKWKDGTDVWAKPIPLTGHGLTNMAYGKDGRAYLMYGGQCFIASR